MLPAFAGMIPDGVEGGSSMFCAPRLRGDDPLSYVPCADSSSNAYPEYTTVNFSQTMRVASVIS